MSGNRHRLAYLSRILPIVSETSVVREIAARGSLGPRIRVSSLFPQEERASLYEAPELAREVEVLFRPANPVFWGSHLFFIFRSPGRYLYCLRRYGVLAPESWRNRRRCLGFFAVAPYSAWLLRRAGTRHLHAHFPNAAASVAMLAAKLAGLSLSFTVHAYAGLSSSFGNCFRR